MLHLIRERSKDHIRASLQSPHAELLLGMVIGLDEIKHLYRFNDILKSTGTIHVVVVSGYNLNLVFAFVSRIFGSQYKLKNLITAQVFALFYALIAGLTPPVLRALIMSSAASWGKYMGRGVGGLNLLVLSALLMLVLNPVYLFSLSFQLSFLASAGLILYSDGFSSAIKRFSGIKRSFFLVEDFATTTAAQVLVWPLISYHFERVSLLSPIINALVLWTVPLATVAGVIFLFVSLISSLLGQLLAKMVSIPLSIFVFVVERFGRLEFISHEFEVGVRFLGVYYLVVFGSTLYLHTKYQFSKDPRS